MAAKLGPKIVNDGLVLCLDAADANSYAGEPTINFSTNPKFEIGTHDSSSGGTWNNWSFNTWYSYNHKIVDVTDAEMIASGFTKALRVTSDGASNSQHLSNNNWGSNITAGTVFSLSFWGRASANDTSWIYSQWEGTVGYPEFTTEWKYFKFDNITKAAGSGNSYPYFRFEYGSPPSGQWFEVTGFQVEAKSYSTPFTDLTRPNQINFISHGDVGSGTTFTDSSINNLTLTSTNGASHAGTGPFGGPAMSFVRGSSQYVSSASTALCDFGTDDFTIDFWFNMNSGTATNTRMHALNIGAGNSTNVSFDFNDSGYGIWVYWMSNGSNYIRQSGNYYNDGLWHHCAFVRDNGTCRLWVDGVYIGGLSYTTQIGATQSLYIGSAAGSSQYWDGYIDEVRIIKGTALWRGANNFSVPTRRGDNGAWLDLSGNSYSGNLINGTNTGVSNYRDGQVIMPINNAYLDFDGGDDYVDGPNVAPNIGAFTYEAVIYRTSSDFLAVGNGVALGGGTNMQIFVYDEGIKVNLYSPQGLGGGWKTGNTIPNVSGTFVESNIYHITVVNSGTVFYFYKNGVSLGSYDHSYLSNTNSTRLGILRNHVQSVGGSGRVYLARMYDKALTATEVLNNYNATKGRFL